MASLLWKRYLHALQTAPLLTKALTAAALAASADVLAQSITATAEPSRGASSSGSRRRAPTNSADADERSGRAGDTGSGSVVPALRDYNWERICKMALFGLLWSGPIGHFWYSKLQKSSGRKESLLQTIQRVLIDQLSYGPLNNAAAMAYIACVVNRLPPSDLPRLMRRRFVGVQLKGWRVWPTAMFINYRFVPQGDAIKVLPCNKAQ